MDTENKENNVSTINDACKDLNLPLLYGPREVNGKYELIIGLEDKKRISKMAVKKKLESISLSVTDIDTFNDRCGHYAYAMVIPAAIEAYNG